MKANNQLKDFNYYLTLFKIEGHETWRADLKGNKDDFDNEWSKGKHPKVTEKKVFILDCRTGEFIK